MSFQALKQINNPAKTNVLKPAIKVALYIVVVAIIFTLISATTSASLPPERKQLTLPELAKKPLKVDTLASQSLQENQWKSYQITIKPNGSLSQALDDIGVSASTSLKIKKTKGSELITRLNAGDILTIWMDENKQLQKIHFPKNQVTHIELTRAAGDNFKIEKIDKKVQRTIEVANGKINGSFYLSAQAAGLSAKTIMSLSDIFGWEIDFIRQLRKGDPFKVIYEKKYINGKYIGDGNILAAEITTNNRDKHTAFLLMGSNGKKIGYYNSKGRDLRKAFLKNPVDYVRITSKFNPKRFHPVLKKWKAHRGVDYGGPVGTPIRATGNGKLTRRGRSNTYGNVVYIQHANKYMTVYAHLSKFGKFKKGQRVKQGQIIGYLGATGRVTGPHLHYEFRKNGVHKDPLKIKFPDAGPVPRKYKNNFVKFKNLMQAQFDRISSEINLAGKFE